MFCPKCKCEYREGFNFCSDCKIELVEKLPGEEVSSEEFEYSELVTITETMDFSIIPIVKSILDSEGIRYFIKGEMIRSIAVLNNIMEIQVPIEEAQKAKDLLKDLDIK
ncbi:putative signal transducing protein [Clostridium estertheticum]|uniref:putative signal transducing protein n=1 Tax=Clostridium estertheticum TaxID=238834 RepID=UPI001C0DD6DF|nr:DUF2007 domain-containing protein [Clostridium estertheticum]MBU3183616.1 DUF2007 domain-containing protein [Clostridium estertheticum]